MIKTKIFNKNWLIEFINGNDPRLGLPEKDIVYAGLCVGSIRRIYIANDMISDKIKETLIHELTHAYMRETLQDFDIKKSEEFICDFIGLFGEEIVNKADKILAQRKGLN